MTDRLLDKTGATSSTIAKRQVSVLFTDMVGYTAIVDELGEEEALAFTQAIYQQMTKTVIDHGGTVRGFAGDSIMALFGIPDAQEDAALRACRAALALQTTFSNAADDFEKRFNVRPGMRVGVSSGAAVMAAVEGENSPITAVGSTVNLASRIQSLASEGGCLICDSTRRLVQWFVNIDFHGEHQVKGIPQPQKLWRLDSMLDKTRRFDASIAHGLSQFVGRQEEIDALRLALDAAKSTIQWVDVIAEPGLGKTRLIFEFLNDAKTDDNRVLTGYCTADGRETPYLPFIQIILRSLEIRESHSRDEIVSILKRALDRWGLESQQNIGLILNILGRNPTKSGLDALDGVLIGTRTRDLLLLLIEKTSREKTLMLVLEDIHWLDKASEEILKTLRKNEQDLAMLVITTRRPYDDPNWLQHPEVVEIDLAPLQDSEITQVACSWLAVSELPNALERRLIERAGGNPLFGEELLNFLIEEGTVKIIDDEAEFADSAEFNDLPASMQSLITARLEQLQSDDLRLLQAASVIGKRFDPSLLSIIVKTQASVGDSLKRLVAHDIIRRDQNASDYEFRHTLVRETVYNGMITYHQSDLHLSVAQAIESRNVSNLSEVADKLAYHFTKTDHTAEAFRYTVLAGSKSMDVFSLGDADQYFNSAFQIFTTDPENVSDKDFAVFASDYAEFSNISLKVKTFIERASAIEAALEKQGNLRNYALFLHHSLYCLICNGRYRQALETKDKLVKLTTGVTDDLVKAYAIASELAISNFIDPLANSEYRNKRHEIEKLLEGMNDPYLQNFYLAQILWNQISRGHVARAGRDADKMLEEGRVANDPRALGYGTAMKALIAMLGADYQTALELSEKALSLAVTEFDRASALSSKMSALIALETQTGMDQALDYIQYCEDRGWSLYKTGPQAMYGAGLAMRGDIKSGINFIENAIKEREEEGYDTSAQWSRLHLCEIYIAILAGEGEASMLTIVRNARTLANIFFNGEKQILSLVAQIQQSPQFDPDGHHIAHSELILGILHKLKKRPGKAVAHLQRAHAIIKIYGSSPMLARIEKVLTELNASPEAPINT